MFKQSPSKKFWICQLNWIISNEMGIKICYPFLGSIIAFEYFVCCQPDCYCLSICRYFFLLLPFWEEFVSKFNRNVLLNFGIIYKFFFWNYYCSRWFVYSSLNYRVVFSVFFIVGGFCSILTIDWLYIDDDVFELLPKWIHQHIFWLRLFFLAGDTNTATKEWQHNTKTETRSKCNFRTLYTFVRLHTNVYLITRTYTRTYTHTLIHTLHSLIHKLLCMSSLTHIHHLNFRFRLAESY